MATISPRHTATDGKHEPDKQQLRHDRMVGIAVLAIIAALMALMMWLASLGGGTPADVHDYWPMMP